MAGQRSHNANTQRRVMRSACFNPCSDESATQTNDCRRIRTNKKRLTSSSRIKHRLLGCFRQWSIDGILVVRCVSDGSSECRDVNARMSHHFSGLESVICCAGSPNALRMNERVSALCPMRWYAFLPIPVANRGARPPRACLGCDDPLCNAR